MSVFVVLDIKVVNCVEFFNKFLIVTNNVKFKYIKMSFFYLYIY